MDNKSYSGIKYLLFGLIIFMMVASPFYKEFHKYYGFEDFMPLKGDVRYAEKPEFSWINWFNGSFQMAYDKYLEDHVGFRPLLVRLYNQIDFSLFRRGHAGGIVIGKEDFLFEINYINAYTGIDYLGDEIIVEKCNKIKVVQEELAKLNTELLVVFAPGKGSFFPEYIPDEYLPESIGITNMQAFENCFRDKGINHINFNTWFCSMKDTSAYALYPKCGIHWSDYGSSIALDSIVRYIENKLGIDMVELKHEGIEISEEPRLTDYDIGDGMNLYFQIPSRPMPYLTGHSYNDNGKVKPGIMVIGDSYYWSIYNKPFSKFLWKIQDFRYYNQESYSPGKEKSLPAIISVKELGKFDVIMLIYTEATMMKFANNFINDAYLTLTSDKEIQEVIERILNTPEWLAHVTEKAEKKGISIEQMLHLDAQWVIEEERKKESELTEN